jgi:CHAT domain-containing protein/Flp pilus assembly protein TadD
MSSRTRQRWQFTSWLAALSPLAVACLGCDGRPARVSAAEPLAASESSLSEREQSPEILNSGASVDRAVAAGSVDRYAVDLEVGTYLHAVLEQQGVDLALAAFDPGGRRLLRIDTPTGKTGSEQVFLFAERSGRHLLEVESLERIAAGEYRLEIVELRAGSETDRRRAEAAAILAGADEQRRRGTPEAREAAVVGYRQAAEGWHELGDRQAESSARERLGWTLSLLGREQEAAEAYREALALAGENAEREQQARLHGDLGRSLHRTGELDAAEAHYLRALERWDELGDPGGEAEVLNNLANVSTSRGLLSDAEHRYQQALERWRRAGDRRNEAITLTNLGVLYAVAGEAEMALVHATEARDLLPEESSPRDRAFVLEQIAGASGKLGRRSEALLAYEDAIALRRSARDKRGEAFALDGLAHLHYRSGQLEEAVAILRRSLELFEEVDDRFGESAALPKLGWTLFKLGDRKAALKVFQRALPLSRASRNRRGEAAALLGIARGEHEHGRLEAARESVEEALRVVEELRQGTDRVDLRTSLFSERQDYFDVAVDILLDLDAHDPGGRYRELAFEVNERSRARLLLDVLPGAWAGRGDRTLSAQRQAHELRERVDSAEERLQDLERSTAGKIELEAAQRELRLALDRLRELDNRQAGEAREDGPDRAAPISLRDLQRQLDGNTLVLIYDLGDERSHLWAISHKRAETFPLPPRDEIERLAREAHRVLSRSHRRGASNRSARVASSLSEVVLGPVGELLEGQRLVIVADGALHYVPFATLPLPGTGGEPLLTVHEVVSSPSVSVAAWMRERLTRRRPSDRTLAVLGDPVFSADDPRIPEAARAVPAAPLDAALERSVRALGGRRLGRLPFSGHEAEAIVSLLPKAKRLSALGFAANKELVVSEALGEYRILHFATHAILHPVYPELSGIVLSLFDREGRPQDGYLRVHEIQDLDLRAELVVLSACQTALGPIVRGEGLIGLAHGFFRAGAGQVVVSLWPVHDQAAAELMDRFYRGMLERGLGPESALREAQLSMARDPRWSPPYFWGGFVIQGAW